MTLNDRIDILKTWNPFEKKYGIALEAQILKRELWKMRMVEFITSPLKLIDKLMQKTGE